MANLKKSEKGTYRMINDEFFLFTIGFNLNLTEYKILNLMIWNITASKTRTYCNIKLTTIAERTGLSISTVSKYLIQLIQRNIIERKSKGRYEINLKTNEWLEKPIKILTATPEMNDTDDENFENEDLAKELETL